MSSVTQVTGSTFKQEVLDSEIPVLVNFWATWCSPCRMIAPVIDEVAEQYIGIVKVVKVNTDENPSIVSEYSIRSIPTLMIFKGGQRVDMVVGAVLKTTVTNTLDSYLNLNGTRMALSQDSNRGVAIMPSVAHAAIRSVRRDG